VVFQNGRLQAAGEYVFNFNIKDLTSGNVLYTFAVYLSGSSEDSRTFFIAGELSRSKLAQYKDIGIQSHRRTQSHSAHFLIALLSTVTWQAE
jgi:hypothetical protein